MNQKSNLTAFMYCPAVHAFRYCKKCMKLEKMKKGKSVAGAMDMVAVLNRLTRKW